jgi:hypothetical protein
MPATAVHDAWIRDISGGQFDPAAHAAKAKGGSAAATSSTDNGAAAQEVASPTAQASAGSPQTSNGAALGKAAPAKDDSPADGGNATAAAPDRAKTMARTIAEQVAKVKDAALKEFADADPRLLAAVQEDMKELDRVAGMFDHALADSLQDLSGASDAVARKTAVAKVKIELSKLLQIVKSEPLIAHIDDNPFGIKTDIAGKLTELGKHVLTLTS